MELSKIKLTMESEITTGSLLESVYEMESIVQSTMRYVAGAQFNMDLSVNIQSTSEAATIKDSTTPSLATFSQWYDENVFEFVEYNPDAVQSLSLVDTSPKDFLSADDIQF